MVSGYFRCTTDADLDYRHVISGVLNGAAPPPTPGASRHQVTMKTENAGKTERSATCLFYRLLPLLALFQRVRWFFQRNSATCCQFLLATAWRSTLKVARWS